MVRANRYALAAAQDGVALEPSVRALHGCDNPVCVRVSRPDETGLLHVVGGSQRDNMEMMGRARRSPEGWPAWCSAAPVRSRCGARCAMAGTPNWWRRRC